ncbi:protein roadkill [Nephila pilipes]|uniref:Protein roadkill n=1 Tax=Nephila pilipes TaxID=299642 RepID=A0A8X6N217_NEPPI|nr:protein roadkill [Nephila pilipes]
MVNFTFVWKIEGYNFLPCYRGKSFKSPLFNVNNIESTFLELFPKGDIFDPHGEALIIILDYSAKFRDISISCDAELISDGAKTKLITEQICENKWKFIEEKPEPIQEIIDLEKETVRINDCVRITLIITCSFSQNGNVSKKFMKNLNELSKDLENIYMNPQFSDLILRAGSEEFHVHKAVIFARLPKLYAELVKKKDLVLKDATLDMEPSLLRMLLSYVYSGKLDSSTGFIPLGLYTVAESYEIADLKEKLCSSPNQMTARMFIKVDHTIFKWDFYDLDNLKPEEKLYGPVFGGSSMPSSYFRMECCFVEVFNKYVLKEFYSPNYRLNIRFHRLCKGNPIFVKCKITVDGLNFLKMTDEYVFRSDEVWEFPSFIELNIVKYFISFKYLDSLLTTQVRRITLRCEFYTSLGEAGIAEETACTNSIFKNFVSQGGDLKNLSNDLGLLYNIFLPNMSDVALRINNVRFPTHKVILAARSPVFAKMFEHDMLEKVNCIVNIDDVDMPTLNLMLTYMYSGKVEVELLNYDSTTKLYRVADKYEGSKLTNEVDQLQKYKEEIKYY